MLSFLVNVAYIMFYLALLWSFLGLFFPKLGDLFLKFYDRLRVIK